MPVIGISFNLVEAKRSKEIVKAEIKVNSTPTVKGVKEMNVPSLGGKKALNFDFEFLTKYDPEVAEIKMGGNIIYLSDKNAAILKQWKKEKRIPEDVSIEILNHLFRRCLIRVANIADDLQLPPPLPMPRVTPQQK